MLQLFPASRQIPAQLYHTAMGKLLCMCSMYIPRSWVFGFPMTPRRHPPPAPGRQTRLPLQRSFPPRAKSIIAQDERQASPLSLTSHSHDSRLHRQSPQGEACRHWSESCFSLLVGHFFPPFFGRFWASMCACDWVLQLLLLEH